MNSKQLREQLDAIQQSTSWKITAPLRWLGRILKFWKRSNFSIKALIFAVLRRLVHQPNVRKLGIKILTYFPRAQRKIRQLLISNGNLQGGARREDDVLGEEKKISPDAKIILSRIRVMIDLQDR